MAGMKKPNDNEEPTKVTCKVSNATSAVYTSSYAALVIVKTTTWTIVVLVRSNGPVLT